ncbi:MAG: hypothetical protein DRN04_08850 [Thermoprotei archaeon]|nr:MAG: hypothetical protein DRN04_08850 [Thermoprotei archaeon]
MSYKRVAKRLTNILSSESVIKEIVKNKWHHYYLMVFQALKAYVRAIDTNQDTFIMVKSSLLKNITSLIRERPPTAQELNAINRVARNMVRELKNLKRRDLENIAIYSRLYNLMLRSGNKERFRSIGMEL